MTEKLINLSISENTRDLRLIVLRLDENINQLELKDCIQNVKVGIIFILFLYQKTIIPTVKTSYFFFS